MSRKTSQPEPLTLEAVRAGAAQVGIELSLLQAEQLAAFASLLQRWNRVHNLTAIDSASGLLGHHLLDSLVLVPELARVLASRSANASDAATVLDVGSGAGLPGLVVAIARPRWHVTLIDAVQKKTAFLTQARVELKLGNVEVVHARVEQFALSRPGSFSIIASRAFADLAHFVRLTRGLLASDGAWLAMKGRAPDNEIAALPSDVRVRAVVPLRVPGLAAERHLVEIVPI